MNAKTPEQKLAEYERGKRYRQKNKEAIKRRKAEYAARNRDAIREKKKANYQEKKSQYQAYNADYYAKNSEAVKATVAVYRAKNKQKTLELVRQWRAINPERARQLTNDWLSRNPERRRVYFNNRRDRTVGKLSPNIVEVLHKKQKGKCVCCGMKLGKDFHLDHIVPLARGGQNIDSNVQLLRSSCNQNKHARDPIEFMQSRGFLL